MKVSADCYPCLQRLAHQAAQLATKDAAVRSRAIEEGLRIIDENFAYDEVSIVIATKVHRAIREITANPDPYREMKEEEIRVSQRLCKEINPDYGQDFKSCLAFSALGNVIDFFRDLDTIKRDMRRPVEFVLNDADRFETRLRQARKVLYLADNAGEVFFDLPLIRWMKQFAKVIYVVKDSPVQNDITLQDLRNSGVEGELEEVITTGTDTPGIDLSLASPQFKQEFESADLIFAKGMGYYETLSELPAEGKVFYCLRAKCKPVADSLGVPLNSYVARLH